MLHGAHHHSEVNIALVCNLCRLSTVTLLFPILFSIRLPVNACSKMLVRFSSFLAWHSALENACSSLKSNVGTVFVAVRVLVLYVSNHLGLLLADSQAASESFRLASTIISLISTSHGNSGRVSMHAFCSWSWLIWLTGANELSSGSEFGKGTKGGGALAVFLYSCAYPLKKQQFKRNSMKVTTHYNSNWDKKIPLSSFLRRYWILTSCNFIVNIVFLFDCIELQILKKNEYKCQCMKTLNTGLGQKQKKNISSSTKFSFIFGTFILQKHLQFSMQPNEKTI